MNTNNRYCGDKITVIKDKKLDLSHKVVDYLNTISEETERDIHISIRKSMNNMPASFTMDTDKIIIYIDPSLFQSKKHMEFSICHEATHGRLIYSLGFCSPRKKRLLNSVEAQEISLIVSMIDDIPVNKILENEGLPYFISYFFETLNRETRAAKKRDKKYYYPFSEDNYLISRFMTYRYVCSWIHLNLFELDTVYVNIIKKYQRVFQNSYPSEYELANRTIDIIQKYDFLDKDEHFNLHKEIYALWGLTHLVEPSY